MSKSISKQIYAKNFIEVTRIYGYRNDKYGSADMRFFWF